MMPLPPKLLLGIVVACVVAAVMLLPSRETLLDRQLRDEAWDKALNTLRNLPVMERNIRAEYYDLLELQLRRRMIPPDDRERFTELLDDALQAAVRHDFSEDFVAEIEKLAEQSLSAKTTYRILAPHLKNLPPATRDSLRISLAKRALAEAEPLLALEIYQQHWRHHANDPEVVFHYINLARGAAKPHFALHALKYYEKGLTQPLQQSSRQLAVLKIRLLRENNQPAEAFSEVQKLYAASDEETRRELYPLLAETAVQSGNSTALLDEMLRRVESTPDNTLRWRELARLAMAAGRQKLAIRALEQVVRQAPKDGESAFKLGQLYEWTERPNDAYDQYLVAIERGHDAALERLLALNPGLYRDVELAGAVVKSRQRLDLRQHGHTMARLFANLNDFERARRFYEGLLRLRPRDAALLAEYGLLELDLGNLDSALKLYSRAAEADPDNTDLVISIAEAQFRADRFDAALATYRKLLNQHPSRSQLENYLRLAESMGRIDDAADVLSSYMADSGDAQRKDFEKLAYFLSILGRQQQLEQTLAEAVRRFPDDERTHKQLLYAYSDNKKPREAAAVLETFPTLATDPELAKFYVYLLSDAKRYQDLERFITERLSPQMADQLKLNELLASVYYETGNTNAAKNLYGKLHRANPQNMEIAMTYVQFLLDFKERAEAKRVLLALPKNDDPRVLKLAAQLHADDREFNEALHYQRRYLDTDPPDAGRDWGFYGDLLEEHGDRPNAHRAYRRAIAEMLATISKIPQTNLTHASFSAN